MLTKIKVSALEDISGFFSVWACVNVHEKNVQRPSYYEADSFENVRDFLTSFVLETV